MFLSFNQRSDDNVLKDGGPEQGTTSYALPNCGNLRQLFGRLTFNILCGCVRWVAILAIQGCQRHISCATSGSLYNSNRDKVSARFVPCGGTRLPIERFIGSAVCPTGQPTPHLSKHPATLGTDDSKSHSSADRSPPRLPDTTRTQSGIAPSRSPASSLPRETRAAPRSTVAPVEFHSKCCR